MRILCLLVGLIGVAGMNVSAAAEPRKLPPDIHPETLSRLPPIERDKLDSDGKRIYDGLNTGDLKKYLTAGPSAVTMMSPKVAEAQGMLIKYLRDSDIGRRYFEIAALVACREGDLQFQWSTHEPYSVQKGLVEQSLIDVIKFNKEVPKDVAEKDATIIRLGRSLLREHKVPSELWAKTVELFGQRGAFEVVATMANFTMSGMMMNAVDQQLPPDLPPLLPIPGPAPAVTRAK